MQDMVLNRVKSVIEDAGLSAVHDRDWANTGVVRAIDDSFNVQFALSYSFQSGYCGLTLSGLAVSRALEGNVVDRISQINVKYRTATINGVEFRVDDRSLAIKYHYLTYSEGEKIRELVALLEYLLGRVPA